MCLRHAACGSIGGPWCFPPLKVTFGNPAGTAREPFIASVAKPRGFASPAFTGFALVALPPVGGGAIVPINCNCFFSTREMSTGYRSPMSVTGVTATGVRHHDMHGPLRTPR